MKDERQYNETITAFTSGDFPEAVRISKKERTPMSDTRFIALLNYAIGTLAMVMGFVALYMVIYFMGTAGR